MQERHKNRLLYFNEQAVTTEKYVIPFIGQAVTVQADMNILEIGCGEGGNLKPFLDLGCRCTGIDLNTKQIENARAFFAEHPNNDRLTLLAEDIYDMPHKEKYDIIMLRDVIEHIHNQERFMHLLKDFMHSKTIVFFGFPAWQMPFGGHQQICRSRLSKIPFIHLLPMTLYKSLLQKYGEPESVMNELTEIKETGITLERFEKILKTENYKVLSKVYWFIQPNYEVKFGLKKLKVAPLLRSLPYIRDFYTTAGYYLISL